MKENMSKVPKIFVLEDSEVRKKWFRKQYEGCDLTIVDNVADAITYLESNNPAILYLGYSLDGKFMSSPTDPNNGYQLARHIEASGRRYANIVIHSMNATGAMMMEQVLRRSTSSLYRASFPELVMEQMCEETFSSV